jgi:hypothetical protein
MVARRGNFRSTISPFGAGSLNIDDVYRLPGTSTGNGPTAPAPTPTVPSNAPRPRNPRGGNLKILRAKPLLRPKPQAPMFRQRAKTPNRKPPPPRTITNPAIAARGR